MILVRLAYNGCDPDKTSRAVEDGNERGVEHHARAIPSQSRDIEHVVGPVVKHASRHNAPEVAPVSARSSSGIMRSRVCPIAWPALWPKMCSAVSFRG